MIIELIDLALDLVGDVTQFEILLRFGWPRARSWVKKLARLSLAAFERAPAELDALAMAAADEQLLEQLTRDR